MKRPAFTLVELLVYLGITSIALVVFMNFMIGIFANAKRADAAQQMTENGRLIMAKLSQSSRFASAMAVTSNKIDLTTPTGTVTYLLTVPNLTENGNNINTGDVRITSFQPVTISPNTLQVTLTIETASTAPNHPNPMTLTTALTTRQAIYQ